MSVFALSTETPADLTSLQRRLGAAVTLLSDETCAFVDALGVRMRTPWYDRVFFRARNEDMAMPLTLVIGRNARVSYLYRSQRVDDRPTARTLLNHIQ